MPSVFSRRSDVMKNLLTAERAILESLSRSSKTMGEIECDTGIMHATLMKIIDELIATNLIKKNAEHYILLCHKIEEQSEVELTREKKRLVADFIDSTPNVHIQKVWLTPYERIIFDQLMDKLDHFMKHVKGKRENDLRTEFQEVVLWGHSPYQELIRNSLNLG